MPTCYLTKEEHKKFDALPEDIRNAFEEEVADEDIDAFENEQQSMLRMSLFDASECEDLGAMLGQLQAVFEAGEDPMNMDFKELSEDAMHMFFSSIGANGVSAFMDQGLEQAGDPEDLKDIGALSRIRHGLLKSNLEFFSHAE